MADESSGDRARIWFRLTLSGGALGPGKMALMAAVATTGSVSAAARSLRMSHARSVKLVAEINALSAQPLIDTRAGGAAGGGAALTPLGCAVMAAYAALDAAVASASAASIRAIETLLDGAG